MITMTKRLEFDAGHRLMNHESKCANLHGHRYAIDVTIALEGSLDHAGRIVDFGEVKSVFGAWVDDELDHTFIANSKDEALIAALVPLQRKRVVTLPFEPSAENLAVWLLSHAARLLDVPGSRRVVRLVLWETPTSSAEAAR